VVLYNFQPFCVSCITCRTGVRRTLSLFNQYSDGFFLYYEASTTFSWSSTNYTHFPWLRGKLTLIVKRQFHRHWSWFFLLHVVGACAPEHTINKSSDIVPKIRQSKELKIKLSIGDASLQPQGTNSKKNSMQRSPWNNLAAFPFTFQTNICYVCIQRWNFWTQIWQKTRVFCSKLFTVLVVFTD